MSVYQILTVLHVLLFAYWLGADWGVFVTSRYVADGQLPLEERRRFLRAAFGIDLMPRMAFTLLLPVGLQLASYYGNWEPFGPFMIAVWSAGLGWLALNVLSYRYAGSPRDEWLRSIDQRVRQVLAPTLIVVGGWSLATGGPVHPTFIAAKLVIFGTMIVTGLALRAIMRNWKVGFQRLAKEGRSPEVDALFTDSLARGRRVAYLMWLLSAVMAVLGVARFA